MTQSRLGSTDRVRPLVVHAFRRCGLATLFFIATMAVPASVVAQSLLAREGLGMPVEALDARERALGSSGVGLPGWYVSLGDPAASAGLGLPAITASFQPASATLTDGRESGFTRFPALAVSYPFAGNVFSLQAGSFLDQQWRVRVGRTLTLGGEQVEAEDVFASDGGVARIHIGWARRILPSLSIGAGMGTHVGTVERTFQRTILDSDVLAGEPGSFRLQGRLGVSGLLANVGVVWEVAEVARLAGSVLWSDELTLAPPDGDQSVERSYSLPLELRGGGTLTLAEDLALHLSGSYADWSEISEDLSEGSARGASWSYGGGVEWGGTTLLGRSFPLRLGGRHTDLPFESGGEPAFERMLSGGFGVYLAEVEGEVEPRARADFSLERGSREGGAISESFWRVTLTLRVSTG